MEHWVRGGLVGRGSFATVNLVLPTTDNPSQNPPTMVVKSSEFSSSDSLSNEKEVLSELRDCPQIVQFLGDSVSIEDGKEFYNLFLEYASRGSLADGNDGGDGMTRAPVVRFGSAKKATELKFFLEDPLNFDTIAVVFNRSSRFGRLQSVKCGIAGKNLYIRFSYSTGDAMGMNMVSKGVQNVLDFLKRTNCFTKSDVRRYTNSILRGLCFIHKKGFAHCYIKLQNILLFENGAANIADFGLARRVAGEKKREKRDGGFVFIGTPLYMSPGSCERL
ncbi:3-hydroxy-3-methylglutaryl-coenzyme A (HMG-CoA) reductase isozyme [Ancistrocladus abbreviatus]